MRQTAAYIVTDAQSGRFKLGHSEDYLKRFKNLQIEPDHDRSFVLESACLTGPEIERILLRMFSSVRIRNGTRDGSTEWFEPSSYEPLLSFIREKLCSTGLVQILPVRPEALQQHVAKAGKRRGPRHGAAEMAECNAAALAALQNFIQIAGKAVRRDRFLYFLIPTGGDSPMLFDVLSPFGAASIFGAVYTCVIDANTTLVSAAVTPLDAHLAAPYVDEIIETLSACAYSHAALELDLIIDEYGKQ